MNTDPYRYFRVEARELVEQISQGVLELEKAEPSAEAVARLLRLAHTLKGAARVVKQPEIGDEAHAIEDALEPLRHLPARLPSEQADRALARLDRISRLVQELGEPSRAQASRSEGNDAESFAVLRADASEMNALLFGLSEVATHLRGIERMVEDLAAAGKIAPAEAGSLNELVLRGGREVDQVSATAERLRLAPASAMFASLERAAREAARAQNKHVELTTSGGQVRLEATTLAAVHSALVQCVRNAVAHGIKARGHVHISAQKSGRGVGFCCDDDGEGLDLDAIRKALVRSGMSEDEADGLGERDLVERLLGGGISTALALDQNAGRGVGLDLVRTTAKQLGGSVRMRNLEQGGTRIEIRIPLTLASSESLLVECARMRASLPLQNVAQTLRVEPKEVRRVASGEAIAFEGDFVPFAHLAELLKPGTPRPEGTLSVVVLRGAAGVAAVAVDRMLGCQDVLMRPLPALAPAHALVLGTFFDAQGNPRMSLDHDAVINAAARLRSKLKAEKRQKLPILVVDDSLTTRMLEQSILESAGYEVDFATSGEEGLQKALLRRYGLFLVDVEMPGIDGFTFVERARSEPRLEQVPAILVTSRSAPEDLERGRRAGAQGYMIKTEFDQGALLERIRGFLE